MTPETSVPAGHQAVRYTFRSGWRHLMWVRLHVTWWLPRSAMVPVLGWLRALGSPQVRRSGRIRGADLGRRHPSVPCQFITRHPQVFPEKGRYPRRRLAVGLGSGEYLKVPHRYPSTEHLGIP